ncbi:protein MICRORCHIDIA 6 [Lactuca sativa]|uniref:protein MICRORCHIDIA 6 n=1 Tax=Lactuca sativa TaxID=4236 RepID=UPI000CC3A649|nr:protein MICRORCHIDIA 6 [Lactuca sativa]XP_023765046.1 protein MICRORCHIDIA 6 [Lactuca sativa]XP_023765047.1 protein MICRORCHIDIA 6 [Lactuca sativa]
MNIHKLLRGNVPLEVDTNNTIALKLEPSFHGTSSQVKHPQAQPNTGVGRDRRSNSHCLRQGSEENWSSSGTSVLDQEQSAVDDANLCSTSSICAAPICRQFWKAGVYNDHITPKFATQSGSSYLHIHPRFLHSNATSHKWVFGAVAELIDNAVDEIQNGATYVLIDKTLNPRNGSSALLIQDDGNGMDPEAMRRCLSFGFSDKKSISSIGKYGNGFKTSSMRLGADVIVFSRNTTNSKMTQSIGLLSYTFLTREGYDKIVVPMVHYEFNFITGSFNSLQSKSNENSNLNLSMLLRWSPYSTEEKLLQQFENVGSHGTKVIVYNLWLDEDKNLELDFESDPEDIRITRDAHGKIKDGSRQAASEQHVANRLRYSLRAYLSILYLKLPETFAIVLRGKVVLYHNVSRDLKYTEFIIYKPQSTTVEVVTTIGFIKEAPVVNIHGFNVYHKNRLILPFCPVVSFGANRGRGVVGVLEANFIEPTHDKQDFEKTSLFQKLAQRLKEMTWEYWDYHCGLIGYQFTKKYKPSSSSSTSAAPIFVHHHGTEQPIPMRNRSSIVGVPKNRPMANAIAMYNNSKLTLESNSLPKPVEPTFPRGFQQEQHIPMMKSPSAAGTTINRPMMTAVYSKVTLGSNSLSKPAEPSFPRGFQQEQPIPMSKNSPVVGTLRNRPMVTTVHSKVALESNSLPRTIETSLPTGFQQGSNLKRKSCDQPTIFKPEAQIATDSNKRSNMPNPQEPINVREQNRKLRARCSEYEKTQEQLKLKVKQLKVELEEAQKEYVRVLDEMLCL